MMETLIQVVKYAQSQHKDIFDVTLFLHSNLYTQSVKKPCSNSFWTCYILKYPGKNPLYGCFSYFRKLFGRSRFYDIACFSILASGPHLDATITSYNIFRTSSIDAIIFNCGPVIWMLLLFEITFSVGPGFCL